VDRDAERAHAKGPRRDRRTRGAEARVTDLLQIGYVSGPAVYAGKQGLRYFHTKREGAQNQPTLYVRDGVGGKDKVLIDVASLSEDGTTALDWWFPSWDGAYVAWGRSESGSEDSVLHIRDVATGKTCQTGSIARGTRPWRGCLTARASTTRVIRAGHGPAGEERYHSRIFHHVVGKDRRRTS